MIETWLGDRRIKYENEERDGGGIDALHEMGAPAAKQHFDEAYSHKISHFKDQYDRSYSLIYEYNEGDYYYIVMRGHDPEY